MKRFAFAGLLLVAAIGCGGKTDTQTAQTSENTSTPSGQAAAAQASVVTNGASTEPGEIVALFLDSLRRGDEKAANSVLTKEAQASLAKTDYAIDPVGTRDGKYTIGRVGFVDGDSSTGLVECVWTEPNPDQGGMPMEMEIVCEVRKEPEGWRISGMAVKMAGSEETFVLDFEDPQSLQQALGGGQQQPQAPGNVAQTPGTPSPGAPSPGAQSLGAQSLGGTATSDLGVAGQVGPASFPAQTNAPAQFPAAPTDGQAPTQIAFPPNPNTGVNR